MFTLRHDDREDGLVNERNDHPGIDTGPAGDDDHEIEMAKVGRKGNRPSLSGGPAE